MRPIFMPDEEAKKKQHSRRELLTGGGLLLLGLPVVGFVVFAVVLVLSLMEIRRETTLGWLVMLVVLVLCLGLVSFMMWRVVRRSSLLVKRIRGLRRERQRTSNLAERDTSRLELGESDTDMISPVDYQDEKHSRL